MKRAEWIAIAAFLVSIAQGLFMLGAVWGQVQDHDRRILEIEAENKSTVLQLTRIERDVSFLADRAREDRAEMRKEK